MSMSGDEFFGKIHIFLQALATRSDVPQDLRNDGHELAVFIAAEVPTSIGFQLKTSDGFKATISFIDKKEVEEFLKDGKKIQAIKKLREVTGWGLKESKDTIDEWVY